MEREVPDDIGWTQGQSPQSRLQILTVSELSDSTKFDLGSYKLQLRALTNTINTCGS